MANVKCLIFDLDGTLVDSEPWSNQAFLNLLPHVQESLDTFIYRYQGRKLSVVLEDIEQRFGQPLPRDFETSYRNEVASLFRANLKPINGAIDALKKLTCTKCIASNGPMVKMDLSLELTALKPFFGDNVFSAYTAQSWKPAPGLFLHAAEAMGKHPSDCIVIEDSEVGLTAAAAAGMRAVHYCPKETSISELWIKHMSELPNLLESL